MLVVGAVLLMGCPNLLDEHIMVPFFTGMWSPIIDVDEMASFGFALSRCQLAVPDPASHTGSTLCHACCLGMLLPRE
eukprot:scaffold103880_cov22-Prasinocladus_malaysianus.AAC.1